MKEIVLKPDPIPAWIGDATRDVTVSRKGMAECVRYIATEVLKAGLSLSEEGIESTANALATGLIVDASEDAITAMLDAAISDHIAKIITQAFNESVAKNNN